MFTGIVETMGLIQDIEAEGSNLVFKIASPISKELKVDQSISHNGVCLTVTKKNEDAHWVTVVQETLQKTNLSKLKLGDSLNLERCLRIGDRLDGHWVQGHVDTTISVLDIQHRDGSWLFLFSYPKESKPLIVQRGSICLNGVSLTVVDVTNDLFSVTIIPYTYEHTQFKDMRVGELVNVEWDVMGKYLWNFYSQTQSIPKNL